MEKTIIPECWWNTGLVALATPGVYKRAALLFDKLIPFCDEDDHLHYKIPEEMRLHYSSCIFDREWVEAGRYGTPSDQQRSYAMVLHDCRVMGCILTPIIDDATPYAWVISPKGDNGFMAALDCLPIPEESSLEWNQVLEFREDKQHLADYRRLRLWILKAQGKLDRPLLKEQLELMLYDYSEALRRHGIKTAVGCLKQIVSARQVVAELGSALGVYATTGSELAAMLTSVGILSGGITVSVIEEHLTLQKFQASDSGTVAYLYEARKRFAANDEK